MITQLILKYANYLNYSIKCDVANSLSIMTTVCHGKSYINATTKQQLHEGISIIESFGFRIYYQDNHNSFHMSYCSQHATVIVIAQSNTPPPMNGDQQLGICISNGKSRVDSFTNKLIVNENLAMWTLKTLPSVKSLNYFANNVN